jgi:hypothetical protein
MAAHQTADQIVEREVRELVRRRGLDPADGDATAVRQLIDEVVADYQERSHTANLPLLLDLAQVAKSVAGRVVGLLDCPSLRGHPRHHRSCCVSLASALTGDTVRSCATWSPGSIHSA